MDGRRKGRTYPVPRRHRYRRARRRAREPWPRAPSQDRSTAVRSPTGERVLRQGDPWRRRPSSPVSAALRADKGERDLGFREERVWGCKEHHRGAARRRREWLRPHACTGEGHHGGGATSCIDLGCGVCGMRRRVARVRVRENRRARGFVLPRTTLVHRIAMDGSGRLGQLSA